MHTIINYTKSPAPAFDAVCDIQEWFGDRYDDIASKMKLISDQEQFIHLCGFAGIKGFPVKAWWEHFHGQGSWKDNA